MFGCTAYNKIGEVYLKTKKQGLKYGGYLFQFTVYTEDLN
jgi:hypothetical protein